MRLEHANLSVQDAGAMAELVRAAFPSFKERGRGQDRQGRPWRHVGSQDFYVALQTVPAGTVRTPYDNSPGLNHLGWEVDSIDALEKRMQAAAFQANLRDDSHPARRRIYFYDPDGNDWEFVEYLTSDIGARHDYLDS